MKAIWPEGLQNEKNINVAFVLDEVVNVDGLSLTIAAKNVYRLFINGKLTGYGPARAAHGYVRIDIYNLSNIKKGERIIIVAEVFGANANNYYFPDEKPYFAAQLTKDSIVHYSTNNGDFKAYLLKDRVQKIQRYSFQRPFAECYVMDKCRTNFYQGDFLMFPLLDTEFVQMDWVIDRYAPYPAFEQADIQSLCEQGIVVIDESQWKWDHRCLHPNDTLRGYLKDELTVCMSDEASAFVYHMGQNTQSTHDIGTLQYRLFDFGRTITGFFELSLSVNKDTTLYLLWDEIDWQEDNKGKMEKNICFYRNTCCNVIKYTLKAGDYQLLAFEPTSSRYVKLIVTQGVVVLNKLCMRSYENPSIGLQFESDDDQINHIIEAAKNTLAQNAMDVLTDCPSRERAGWLCDSYFSARAEKLITGKNNIEKSFLENYVLAPQLSHLPEGMLPMCYPCDHYDGNYIPNWAMWFVVELKDYLRRTGDRRLIDRSKDKVYNIISYFDQFINEEGLLENLKGWIFIEWSMCNDAEFIKGVNYPSNMLFAKMLDDAGELYFDDALAERANHIKKKIIEQSFNGTFFEDNRIRENGNLISVGHITETCQYYAFFCDVADRERFSELYKTLITTFGPLRDAEKVYPDVHKSNAFIGNYLRLEILLKNRLKSQVVDECKDFFYFMAKRTGTLWEHAFPFGSLNHGFASVAANYILECVAGFVDADVVKKVIYLSDSVVKNDMKIKIPIEDDLLEINYQDGIRTVKKPDNYTIVYVKCTGVPLDM